MSYCTTISSTRECSSTREPVRELVDCGKRAGKGGMSQTEINALMIWHALQGGPVTRLKGGDPFVFRRGGRGGGGARRGWASSGRSSLESPPASPPRATRAFPLTHQSTPRASRSSRARHAAKRRGPVRWTPTAHTADTLVIFMCARTIGTDRRGPRGRRPFGLDARRDRLPGDLGGAAGVRGNSGDLAELRPAAIRGRPRAGRSSRRPRSPSSERSSPSPRDSLVWRAGAFAQGRARMRTSPLRKSVKGNYTMGNQPHAWTVDRGTRAHGRRSSRAPRRAPTRARSLVGVRGVRRGASPSPRDSDSRAWRSSTWRRRLVGRPERLLRRHVVSISRETYQLRRRVEARYGIEIRAVETPLTPAMQSDAYGERLWERDPDLCCWLRKVEPLRGALDGLGAWVTGVRRGQPKRGARCAPSNGIRAGGS
jgi:hypothetical protein